MTRLYINLSYTLPDFHRHKYILIQQRGILWSKHSCFVPYFEWKKVFQTLHPVEIGYERLKQLQYDNATYFRAVKNIYSINCVNSINRVNSINHVNSINRVNSIDHGIFIDPIYSKKVLLTKQRLYTSISLLIIYIYLYYFLLYKN